MNRKSIKTVVLVMMVTLLALGSLAGCTEEEETENVVVKFPMLIPESGAYSIGYSIVGTTAQALIQYINEEDPIEGVTLELDVYDSESTSEQAIPGYQALKGRGAKFIGVTDTEVIPTLKNTVDTDKFPVFMCSGTAIATEEPGYVFCIPMIFYNQIQPLMEYIMDEWDYTANPSGPKIGILGFNAEYGLDRQESIKDYIEDNPGKFADDKAVIRQVAFPFGQATQADADALENCDYIFAGATSSAMYPLINTFLKDGDSIYCFLGSDTGFMSVYAATEDNRETIDGTLWASDGGYYVNDTDEISVLSRKLVDDYFSDDVTNITPGLGTLVWSLLVPIEIVRAAVEDLDDPADLTGQMIYDKAISMTFSYDGFPDVSYSATKRALLTQEKIYEYSAADNDWSPVSDWITAPAYE